MSKFRKRATPVLMLTVFVLSILPSIPVSCASTAERSTLIDLYISTNGDSWFYNDGWKEPPLDVDGFAMPGTENSWYGVTCDASGNVIELILNQSNLSGTIPDSIGDLTNLQHLQLGHNQLTGSIPPELGNLNNLQSLDLSYNQLTGSIPPELGNLTNLQILYLHSNQLTGSIPPELGNLTNLQRLYLGYNQLNGSIPPELGNLTDLQSLRLWSNQLTGSIPPELGNLTNLQGLQLGANQLNGSIPPELGNLTDLQDLQLWSNQLTGSIPPELGNLTNLQFLQLGANQLTGSIPPELGNLNNLQVLELYWNQLNGSIPPELGNLNNLQILFLGDNPLTGSIPPELGNLTNLLVLYLGDNQLTGSIPPELGNLTNLQILWLYSNQLEASIPTELQNLTNLNNGSSDIRWNALYTSEDDLRIFLNSKQNGGDWESTQTVAPTGLTASVPTTTSVPLNWTKIPYTGDTGGYEVYYSTTPGGPYELFETTATKSVESTTVTDLISATDYYFVLRTVTEPHANNENTVYSGYSDEVSATTATDGLAERNALIDLYMSTNGDSWFNNDGWKEPPLDVDGFAMPGTENSWYGVTCNASGNVIELILNLNNLTGTIPDSIGDLTNLQSLHLGDNQLTGSIPPELGNLNNLQSLDLSYNQLNGSIPPELGNLTNLQILQLYWNQLTGSIPPELENLTNLQRLLLGGNQLTGSIPPELGNLNNLQILYLGANQLTGSIPPELGNLNDLQSLQLYSNQLTGSIPTELGNLTNLQTLQLGANQLNGSIPTELGNLNNLQTLYLYSNQLTGSIPPELGNLTNLLNLYLGHNQLNGSIPTELGNLTNLQRLQLHSNQLEASIPTELQNLTNLVNGLSDFRWNALYTSEDDLRTFLNSKQTGGDWESTQTVAPTGLTAGVPTTTSVPLNWTKIPYTGDTGGYEVYYSTTSGGPYELFETTATKSVESTTVTGLISATDYFFVLRTVTEPHGDNENTVYSGYSDEVSATTEPETPTIDEAVKYIEANVEHHGIAKSLISKLENALKARDRGNTEAFENILNAFINQVEAQSGKKIEVEDAAMLIEWAEAWIEDHELAK